MAKTKKAQVDKTKVLKDKAKKTKKEEKKETTKASTKSKRKEKEEVKDTGKKAKTSEVKTKEKKSKEKTDKKEPAPKRAKTEKLKDVKEDKEDKEEKQTKEVKDPEPKLVPNRRLSGKTKPDDGFTTPPVHGRSAVSPSVDSAPSTCTSLVSMENIAAWKKAADAKGITLEEHMEEISRAALEESLEEQMKEMAAAQGESVAALKDAAVSEEEGKEAKAIVPAGSESSDSEESSSEEDSSDDLEEEESEQDGEVEDDESEEDEDEDEDALGKAVDKHFDTDTEKKEEKEEKDDKDESAPTTKRPSALRRAPTATVVPADEASGDGPVQAAALGQVVEQQRDAASTNFATANSILTEQPYGKHMKISYQHGLNKECIKLDFIIYYFYNNSYQHGWFQYLVLRHTKVDRTRQSGISLPASVLTGRLSHKGLRPTTFGTRLTCSVLG